MSCRVVTEMIVGEGLPLIAISGRKFGEGEWLSGAVVSFIRVAEGREGDWPPCVVGNCHLVVEMGGGGGAVEGREWS